MERQQFSLPQQQGDRNNKFYMKNNFLLYLILFFAISANATSHCDSSKILSIIFMNDNAMRPIALSKDDFWQSSHLSKITFQGSRYFDLVKYRLSKNKKDVELNGFSVSVAVIFSENQKADTLYTTHFFNNWLINGESFTSTDDFLYKMFNPLYLGNFISMKTGDD